MSSKSATSAEDLRTIKTGALAGAACICLIFSAGWTLLGKLTSTCVKIAFTLRWQILSSVVLVMAIKRIGSLRYKTGAIDPVRGRSEQLLGVDARFLTNTLEQVVVNCLGQIALTTYLDGDNVQRVIPTLVVIFVIGRIAFIVGYRIKPVYRALGFAMTFVPCALTHAYCVFCLFVYGPMYGF